MDKGSTVRTINRGELALAAALSAVAGYMDAFILLGGYFVSFMSGNRSMSHDAGRRGPASVPTSAPSGTWLMDLDTARDADVDHAGRGETRDQMVGLLRRTALAVDGGGAGLPTADPPRATPSG